MKTRAEARHICADILLDLRTKAKLSKAKMADLLNITERTYTRYENGESSPPLEDFLEMLHAIDAPALPTVLRHLYPDNYDGGVPKESSTIARNALANYILHDASDRDIRQLLYIYQADHGSSFESQLQLFCAIDHLPMDVKLLFAKFALNAWEIESDRGGLINTDDAMPDMELLRAAVIRAQKAVTEGRSHYTNITI